MTTRKFPDIPIWVVLMILVGIVALIGMYGQAMYATGFSDGLENHIEDQKEKDKYRVPFVGED